MAGPVTGLLDAIGCKHPVIGLHIKGRYSFCGWNHGKPAYKMQSEAYDVFLYFWSDPTHSFVSGWWFGPAIGVDKVYAFHPQQEVETPLSAGWMVPPVTTEDGAGWMAPDSTLRIVPAPPPPPTPPPPPPAPPAAPIMWRRRTLRADGRTRTHWRAVPYELDRR
jgi:hypothetical protein